MSAEIASVGARFAQDLRRLDKLGTVDDPDELLESNLSKNIDRFLCLSLAAEAASEASLLTRGRSRSAEGANWGHPCLETVLESSRNPRPCEALRECPRRQA